MNHDEENAVSSLEIDNPIVNDSTTEKAFESIDAPTWREQLTIRAFVVSFILSILFTFIVMKLNLTTGIIPSLNVSAGLLGFFFVKSWTKLVERFWVTKPFARQENTVIQTCVVASSGIAFSKTCNTRIPTTCGVMMNIVSTASDLSQDFKTGYLTLASPRSMFVSQFIGRVNGCVISPSVFWIFYKAFPDLGSPASKYPSPFGTVYRNIAALGIDGVGSLPKNCLAFCIAFFLAAIVINFIKDNVEKRWFKYIPVPMAMAIPFYLGGYFAIDMCLGSLILFVWEYRNKADAKTYAPTVASGLICGDGIWTLPSSFLALAVVKPPICMNFVSASQAAAEGL